MSRLDRKNVSSTCVPNHENGRKSLSVKAMAQEDKIFAARQKFERWISAITAVYRHAFVPLVGPTDDGNEGVFEADELALVPTRDLENYRCTFDEAQEMFEFMREQLEAALAAREAEGT